MLWVQEEKLVHNISGGILLSNQSLVIQVRRLCPEDHGYYAAISVFTIELNMTLLIMTLLSWIWSISTDWWWPHAAVLKLTQLCCTWPYCAEVGPTVLKLVQLFYSKVGPTVIKLVQLLSSWSNCSEVDLAVLKLTPLYCMKLTQLCRSWPNCTEIGPTVLKLTQLCWSWPTQVDPSVCRESTSGRTAATPAGRRTGRGTPPAPPSA